MIETIFDLIIGIGLIVYIIWDVCQHISKKPKNTDKNCNCGHKH
jgi:hypothetical protein